MTVMQSRSRKKKDPALGSFRQTKQGHHWPVNLRATARFGAVARASPGSGSSAGCVSVLPAFVPSLAILAMALTLPLLFFFCKPAAPLELGAASAGAGVTISGIVSGGSALMPLLRLISSGSAFTGSCSKRSSRVSVVPLPRCLDMPLSPSALVALVIVSPSPSSVWPPTHRHFLSPANLSKEIVVSTALGTKLLRYAATPSKSKVYH